MDQSLPHQELFRCFSTIENFEGWMIGKMCFCHLGVAEQEKGLEAAQIKKRKNHYAIVEVRRDAYLAQMLLVKPAQDRCKDGFSTGEKERKRNTLPKPDLWKNGFIGKHTFHREEIIAFVEAVQDANSIHRTERPIVPGLQMVEWFWSISALKDWTNCEFSFRTPAYAEQELQVYQCGEEFYCLMGDEEVLWTVRVIR